MKDIKSCKKNTNLSFYKSYLLPVRDKIMTVKST